MDFSTQQKKHNNLILQSIGNFPREYSLVSHAEPIRPQTESEFGESMDATPIFGETELRTNYVTLLHPFEYEFTLPK